ncbi:MAG: C45 family autoproteolytic acyltransferase/hydrolase [Candidatus Hodarchaeota archaeon]
MIELTIEGSYYDIGYWLGKKIDTYQSSYFSNNFTKEQIDFAYECLKSVKQFFPELLHEIQGIVDGGNLDYDNLLTSEIGMGFHYSCTVFAIPAKYTKNGKMLFARSMDWFNEAIPYAYIFRIQPEKKYANLGFTESLTGRLGGINEAGLVIGDSNCVWSNFQPGLISGAIVRWILDNCKSVQEAVDFLERIPHVIGNNYLIADTNNIVARVEAFQRNVVTNYFQDEFTVTANHYFSSDFDFIANIKPKHSTDRIDFLYHWINKLSKPVDVKSVKEIQRTHEVELCPHVQEEFNGKIMDLTTSWAWIHELGSNKVHLCEGSPCKNEYKEYNLQ